MKQILKKSLKSFLDGSVNIFEDKDVLDHLYDEVPVVIEIISKIIKYEKAEFLPEPVRGIFEFMLKLLNQVQKLATLRHVPAKKYIGKEPYTEFFPSLPLHSEKITFKVDKENFHDDESIEDVCNKDYPRAPKMTPGLAHIFCRHGICKGFVSMTTAESPQIFTNILTRRLPKTVKAQRRVFLYDNSCNMHKHALRRGSKEILNFKLFTDRHHWKNHVGCSESWDPFFRKDTHCLDLYQNIYFSNATIFQIGCLSDL